MAHFLSFADAVKTGNGFIQVPVWDKVILDRVGKRGVMMQRIKAKKATGNPTRYFEHLKADQTAAFQDPHNLAADKYKVKRVDKSAFVKAITNEIEFGHFDREVANQQGLYNGLTEADIQEMVTDLLNLQDEKLWTGNDTSLSASTTNEYVGLLTQITQKGSIAAGKNISEAIRTEVARQVARTDYQVRPSIIVVNPLTWDLIEQEEAAANNTRKNYEVEVVAGIKVPAIMTAQGLLPIVADPYLPLGDTGTKDVHRVAILDESLLERHYVGSDKPRIFAFGIQDESLNTKYMALQYDCIIAKGADYGHIILEKEVARS